MRAYFDTEFTDFKPAHLISIGVVRDDGAEYYAVLSNTWEKSQCNDFVIATVLPQLDEAGHIRSLREVESDLRELLKDGYSLVCDSMYDWFDNKFKSQYGSEPNNASKYSTNTRVFSGRCRLGKCTAYRKRSTGT